MENEPRSEKKRYEAPAFRVVRLEVKANTLAICRLSTIFSYLGDTIGCKQVKCRLGA